MRMMTEDSRKVHYLHSGDSRFIAPETHKLQRSATSRSTFSMEKDSGEIHRHYQKRNERFYRYTKNSDQSTIEKTPNMEGTQSEALEQEKDESRTKGKRRFTLRLLTRRKSKEKSNSQVPAISSAESNIVRESSETQSINRGFLSSTPTDSPVESTSSLGEHKLKRVLTMALPESLMRQNPTVQENLPKDGFERHHEASTISIIKEPSQWPWGNPVPFWKGTPIHQVLWGGFEVNVAGVRSLAGRNKYILRIRRPLRLDEYVLRKESDFRKFFKALSKEFPQAHLRRLPARANRFDSKENDTEQIFEPGTERLAMRSEISAAAPTSTGHNNFEGSNIWENTNLDPTEVFSGSPYAQSSVKKDPDTIDNQKLESPENNTDGGKKPEVGKPSSSWSKTRRRNTLASLFVGGNHQSKFSFDTHSDHDDETNNAGFEKNYIETVKGLSSDKKKGSDDRHLSLYASFRSTKGLIEEHRRDLRSWLRDTLSIRNTGHHQETAAFLLLGSIVPTDEDLIDIRRRETIDEERRKKRTAEAQGAAERARVVHDWWKETKEDFFYGDGILNLSNALRQYSRVEQLPIKYQKSLEWMRMSFAEWLHELLISGDQSELFFKKLISFNEAFPWQMVKTALRIRKTKLMSNKMSEIFFSQKPNLGKRGRSVIQRMIGITISENDGDPTEIARRIHSCRSRIQSLTMCEKIIKYAYAPRDTKELFRRYSQSLELVVTIVRSAEEPRLDKYDLERIIRASKSYASLLRKNGNRITSSMTENINVRLILDLKLYLRLISEERDAKQVREMLREDSTIGSLEIVVAPFAEFLKRTYKITNCVETIEDLRIFFQQLIVIVHALRSRIQDPQKSIRVLSRLLEKHQSSVYQWFHSVHIRDPTMAEVFQWLKSVVDLLKKGLTEPIVVSEIFSSVEDLGALEKELDSIVDWEEQKRKRKYEQVCRRYSADVDGDDAVIVEGDGFGKSKTEPLVEILTPQPSLDHIGCCLNYFRVAISKTLLGN
ncbi:hypothetical protein BY996DRAFT_3865544 [Phakopsora pachyrhizi]|nr:hypothetical protein BY996DRAFT_3865544 [Phakopsora pachyrhizi]